MTQCVPGPIQIAYFLYELSQVVTKLCQFETVHIQVIHHTPNNIGGLSP